MEHTVCAEAFIYIISFNPDEILRSSCIDEETEPGSYCSRSH